MADSVPRTPLARRRTRAPQPPRRITTTASDDHRDAWALLLNVNARAVALATTRLAAKLSNGLRHFSAVRRAVPLHRAAETHRDILAGERTIDPTEVFSNHPPRKWQRKPR